jgi:nitrite reductase/ring-hydroxylating ferredoxin subunit
MDQTPLDLTRGIAIERLPDGSMLAGKVGDDDVLLARRGDEIFAVGAKCTHYGADLVEGLVVDDQIRCPWHHACFSLRTGEVLRRPALDPLSRWRVERSDGRIVVREQAPAPPASQNAGANGTESDAPEFVVIVGGGAAGLSAADSLRRQGYRGALTMVSADSAAPCDRPNLSKDYLAGKASDDWIPLRPETYYRE